MIQSIQAFALRAPLTESYGWARGKVSVREALLVRLVADDGTEGWGECAGPPAVLAPAVSAFFGPHLLGQDPLATDPLWDRLWQAALPYGRRGVLIGALSGIDMALWDLKGKLLGQIDKLELDNGGYNELWEERVRSVNANREDEIDNFFGYRAAFM